MLKDNLPLIHMKVQKFYDYDLLKQTIVENIPLLSVKED